ncbi:hypothetical protein ACFU7T_17285 [Streptomyces sp. NPDC057555]|uniref:hypothetical protein n=1 Tax=Streptomyces sp. NPDC057555 TaxID=3346166 RepID=UPI0036B64343
MGRAEFGARAGYSPSTIASFEQGRRIRVHRPGGRGPRGVRRPHRDERGGSTGTLSGLLPRRDTVRGLGGLAPRVRVSGGTRAFIDGKYARAVFRMMRHSWTRRSSNSVCQDALHGRGSSIAVQRRCSAL